MQPIKVLVVDDSVVIRRLLTAVLDAEVDIEVVGYSTNGRLALSKIEQLDPDVISLDVMMPEMDGIEATAEMRRIEAESGSGKCPIVALTANALNSHREKCLEAGMDDFLSKPITKKALSEAISKWTSREDLQRTGS